MSPLSRAEGTPSLWLADVDDGVLDHSIGELLVQAAAKHPERLALVERLAGARQAWTYEELSKSAYAVATQLVERFDPGDRLATWMPNTAAWVITQLGASLAGMVVLPMNPSFGESEVGRLLERTKASGIVYQSTYRSEDRASAINRLAATYGLKASASESDVVEWASSSPRSDELPPVDASDAAAILFTSGTTGVPKGAVLAHRGLVNAAYLMMRTLGFSPESPPTWLNVMPFFHVGGFGTALLGVLTCQGTLIVLEQYDGAEMVEAIEHEKVTGFLAVPTMLFDLLDRLETRPLKNHTVAAILTGGANVPPKLVRRVMETFDCTVHVSYGQTEAHGAFTATLKGDPVERIVGTVGSPVAGVDLMIRDLMSGQPVPLGSDGEICFRGVQTMLEYFSQPAETAAAFDDGWLRTGDIGHLTADGYVVITGRLKEMIIRGGENVFPQEIENALLEVQGIDVVLVAGVPDERWGEEVGAILSNSQVEPTAANIRRLVGHCRRRLAGYKVPRYWFFMTDVPRTSSGKVQKGNIIAAIRDGSLAPDFVVESVREGRVRRASPGDFPSARE